VNARQRVEARESSNSDYLIALRDKQLADAPVELVPLEALDVRSTPRVAGEDLEYARTLAQSEATLPPILVHRPTMRVIDGAHRLRAAVLRGQDHIAARFFDGDEGDADLLAVALNVAQGLPLSTQDRTAAAERIFVSHPQWSDRAVAAVAGLSAKKVSEIRRLTVGEASDQGSRIGRDGRARPLNAARGRALAGELIRADPGASLRQIGRKAGVSPATVADVRDRMRRGDDPVPMPTRQVELAVVESKPQGPARGVARQHAAAKSPAELSAIFEALRRDPSLRFNEMGRTVLRMLDACAVVARDRQKIAAVVPLHCKGPLSELVHGYADVWQSFAQELQQDDLPGAQSG
jgi:ParB-like chromosome segregation protein Spo0J